MHYRLLADAILLLHLAFVLFAVLGGLLLLRHPRLICLHLPALLWGVTVEWADWICPLTPLENQLRMLGGQAGYAGGFIEHFVLMVLYPENLTVPLRMLLGLILVLINLSVYAFVIAAWRKRARLSQRPVA